MELYVAVSTERKAPMKGAMSVIMVRMAMQHNELGCMTTILGFVSMLQR